MSETTNQAEHDLNWLSATIYRGDKNQNEERWIAAFEEYNLDHADKPLKMVCRPCYAKVLIYLRSKYGR